MNRIKLVGAISAFALVAAFGFSSGCGEPGGGGGGTGVNPSTSQNEVDSCKESCQQQKFFDCYDAQEHAACFDKCEQAESSDIETFVACVGTDTCDAECSLNVQASTTGGTTSGGTTTTGGTTGGSTGGTSTPCVEPCQRLKSDECGAFATVNCQEACQRATESDKKTISYCEGARNGCEFSKECEGIAGQSGSQCKAACQNLGTFDCIQMADVSECQSRCDEISSEKAEGFVSCVNSGICEDDSCYEQISEGGASADVSGCQSTCDDMKQFDCLSSTQHSECRSTCESASKSSIETFKSCADGICDDDSCYQSLLSANG